MIDTEQIAIRDDTTSTFIVFFFLKIRCWNRITTKKSFILHALCCATALRMPSSVLVVIVGSPMP
jgi:hypothetical protein